MTMMKMVLKEWSVGFRSLDDGLERLPSGDNVRVIKALDWVEVSPVMRGASPDTQTIISKTATTTSEAPEEQVDEKTSDVDVAKIEKLQLEIEIEKNKLDIMEK